MKAHWHCENCRRRGSFDLPRAYSLPIVHQAVAADHAKASPGCGAAIKATVKLEEQAPAKCA